LYEDIGERMVGDIDLIVSQTNFKKTIQLLKKQKYTTKNEVYRNFHWHYPKMVKENRIAAVEVHNKVLKKPYTQYLDYQTLKKDSFSIHKITVASFENKSLITVLQKQINDNLYFSKTITLRNVYDSYLLATKTTSKKRILNNKKLEKYLNNYAIVASEILNYPKSLAFIKNEEASKYLKSYLLILENSKAEIKKINLINSYLKLKDKVKILQYSFTDKEYRTFTFRRFKNIEFYLKQLGLIKSKPNL